MSWILRMIGFEENGKVNVFGDGTAVGTVTDDRDVAGEVLVLTLRNKGTTDGLLKASLLTF